MSYLLRDLIINIVPNILHNSSAEGYPYWLFTRMWRTYNRNRREFSAPTHYEAYMNALITPSTRITNEHLRFLGKDKALLVGFLLRKFCKYGYKGTINRLYTASENSFYSCLPKGSACFEEYPGLTRKQIAIQYCKCLNWVSGNKTKDVVLKPSIF